MPDGKASIKQRLVRRALRVMEATTGLIRRVPGVPSERRPLYRSGPLEDLLFAQPLNWFVRRERRRALRSGQQPVIGSVAVIIVNYNTREVLETTLAAVKSLSPDGTRIVVVDNASTDGSGEWLKTLDGIELIDLPANIGHGRALDAALFRTSTDLIVTLDSDAFPIAPDWIDQLKRLMSPEIDAAGWRGGRDRLHPCLAIYRRRVVMDLGISFANFGLTLREPNPVFGENAWDTGELISEAIGPERLALLDNELTPFGGRVIRDLGYHHCGATTLITESDDHRRGTGHEAAWTAACRALLEPAVLDRGTRE